MSFKALTDSLGTKSSLIQPVKEIGHRHRLSHHQLRISIIPRVILLMLSLLTSTGPILVLAQSNSAESERAPFCNRSNAIDSIRQQIELAKTIDDSTRRIAVLIRAADLLWPVQQQKARAVFSEAFELATENEKANGQKAPRSVVMRMQTPDQRYVVIRAVAKRDPALAKELTSQILKQDSPDAISGARDSFKDILTAERLRDSAIQLIPTDINAAVDLARTSLTYPASSGLTRFLYRFAEVNQQGSDQLYAQALAVYGDRPMREFLYLETYPFAMAQSVDTPLFASYVIPSNFVTNQSLQRRFVGVMLRRVQQALEVPLDEGDNYRNVYGRLTPGTVHLLQALMRIEPQVRSSLPDLTSPVLQARERLLVSLSAEDQKRLVEPGREISVPPEQSFAEQIEAAEKLPSANDREEAIATAVLSSASDRESMANVIEAIDKISNSSVRAPLLQWFYFRRATAAIKDRKFEEAERISAQVEGNEQRAYLHTEIARGLLSQSATQARAGELLEAAIAEATKADTTNLAARSLLTVSNLYIKIDPGRSISLLADAINRINHIETPDFSSNSQTMVKLVERTGKSGQYSLQFYMPGLDPESAFRELAKIDFNDALTQTAAFTDKFQRAMTTLAVSDVCLQETERRRVTNPKKTADH